MLLGFRDATQHPGHKEIQIFAGRNEGSRGNCGTIKVRDDEWPEVRAGLLRGGFDEMPPIAKWPPRCQRCHQEFDALCEHPDAHGMLLPYSPYRVHPAFDGDTETCTEQVHPFEEEPLWIR